MAASKHSSLALTVTVLGSGTSSGVPLILCRCAVCRSRNPKNKRTRASVYVQTQGLGILIDSSTDFRSQALRWKIPRIDAVLYTHPHADHIHGIDDLRAYNFVQKSEIPVFGNAWTAEEMRVKFPYIFASGGKTEGGGIPRLTLHPFSTATPSLDVRGVSVTPVSLEHGSKECVAYRIGGFAYVTDCHRIPEASLARLKDLDTLILDCVRHEPHATHLHLAAALEVVERLKPRKTYLTHLGHEFDHEKSAKELPKGVAFAYDGLRLRIAERGPRSTE